MRFRFGQRHIVATLVLLGGVSSLLDRQITALADTFQKERGFAERIYHEKRVS